MSSKEVWDEYPEVYHYTKFSTALLIIHSATLRATRYDLLNDTQEIHYAKDIIAAKLLEEFPHATLEQAKHDLEIFREPLGNSFFITSFCGKNSEIDHHHRDNGLLSMWRNYGTDGGCAIAFNTRNIFTKTSSSFKSLKPPPACVMDKVIYKGENDDDQDYCDRLSRFVNHASELITNPIPNPNDRDLGKTREILEDFLYLMICSKHPAFFEEREVRIGLCFTDNQGGNQARSLQQFHTILFSPTDDIPRIIIGPHRDQLERFNFLKSYLSKFDLNIDVKTSEIPLRF